MTPTPPDLDTILESIRARVAGDVIGDATGDAGAAIAPAPVAGLPPKPARLVAGPVIDGAGVTVEALFTALLEPMLRQWLDANLPEICERVAQAEIRRLTGQP